MAVDNHKHNDYHWIIFELWKLLWSKPGCEKHHVCSDVRIPAAAFFLFSCLQQLLQVIALNVTVVKFNWSNLFRFFVIFASSIALQLAELACEFELTCRELSNSEFNQNLSAGDYFWEARTKYSRKSFPNNILMWNRTLGTFQTPPTWELFEQRLAHRLQHHYSHPLIHPSIPHSFVSWTSGFPFPLYFNNSASSLHIFVLFISPRAALLGSLNHRRFVLCSSAENLSDEKSECVTFGKWKIVVKTSEESRKKILH